MSHQTEAEKKAFAEKVRSLSFSTGAANSKGDNRSAERRLDRDMGAYRRLRDNGLQPPGIRGAGDLEARAQSPVEVETGELAKTDRQRRAMEKAHSDIKGGGT
tara:strand:+ start:3897 stop:4205 length:309 start_codon:yes stop_codon:yes gene_type:complete